MDCHEFAFANPLNDENSAKFLQFVIARSAATKQSIVY